MSFIERSKYILIFIQLCACLSKRFLIREYKSLWIFELSLQLSCCVDHLLPCSFFPTANHRATLKGILRYSFSVVRILSLFQLDCFPNTLAFFPLCNQDYSLSFLWSTETNEIIFREVSYWEWETPSGLHLSMRRTTTALSTCTFPVLIPCIFHLLSLIHYGNFEDFKHS